MLPRQVLRARRVLVTLRWSRPCAAPSMLHALPLSARRDFVIAGDGQTPDRGLERRQEAAWLDPDVLQGGSSSSGGSKSGKTAAVLSRPLRRYVLDRVNVVASTLVARDDAYAAGSGGDSFEHASLVTGEQLLAAARALEDGVNVALEARGAVGELREEVGVDGSADELELLRAAEAEADEAAQAVAPLELELREAIAADELVGGSATVDSAGEGSLLQQGGDTSPDDMGLSLDSRSAIIEVRAAAGGDEAGLFAFELLEMVHGFADKFGWGFETLQMDYNQYGGLKCGTARVSGESVYASLKYESGVHRVQRVPATESGGRVHTSTAAVVVLPEAQNVDIRIEPKDLRIDTYRSSGAGGQHVNTTDSAVRITHIPTGVVVAVQDERSQHKNKDKAMSILRSRIFDQQRSALAQERKGQRAAQIGSGDRSERIRTYNYSQGRVTDHRSGESVFDVDGIMDGSRLEELHNGLRSAAKEQALDALERRLSQLPKFSSSL